MYPKVQSWITKVHIFVDHETHFQKVNHTWFERKALSIQLFHFTFNSIQSVGQFVQIMAILALLCLPRLLKVSQYKLYIHTDTSNAF